MQPNIPVLDPADSTPQNNDWLPALSRALDDSLERPLKAHGRRPSAPGWQPLAGDDPRAGFKNLGEFALAVKDACQPGKRPDDRLLSHKAASGMGEAFGSDGGFLVPPDFADKILQRIY